MNSDNRKKLGTLTLQLAGTDSKYKIGKINEKLNYDKVSIAKDKHEYKLSEKKSSKEPDTKFTGTQMKEQTSKYFIFKVNADGKTVDVVPADDWYIFKKDITYTTMLAEEVEEKMKISRFNNT